MILAVSLRVVMRCPPQGVALAWLLFVVLLPIAGALVYLAIGERRLGVGWARRHALLDRVGRNRSEASRARTESALQALGNAVSGAPLVSGNALQLMSDIEGLLANLCRDIAAASRSVDLEFYIWQSGGAIDRVEHALREAVARGVECRVLVDAQGSRAWLRSAEAQALRAAGVRVLASLPVGMLRALVRRSDLRNHRKLVIIDGNLAYTGSFNMVDPATFHRDAGVGEWVDAMVRVEGGAVQSLGEVFLADWFMAGGGNEERGVPAAPKERGRAALHLVPSGPDRWQVGHSGSVPSPGTLGEPVGDALLQMLLMAIYGAQSSVSMTTPYFVPDESLVVSLRAAAMRGVRVTLIVPERVDSWLVHRASRSYFAELMDSGVEIRQFRGGLLHTKSVVVDGRVSVFGTANLDMRSLWLNFELTLFVYDATFGRNLLSLHARYSSRGLRVDPVHWGRRRFCTRCGENVARLLAPLL